MSNKRKIFVGSSSEVETMANEFVGQLLDETDMELVRWRSIFQAGDYPLEVFEENLPNEIIGAILFATPDIFGKRGDTSFDAPVPNIVLEYGYLAARIGRSRVAIFVFDDVNLPSDLAGLTNIKAGKYEKGRQLFLQEGVKTQLLGWLKSLPYIAEEIPLIRQLHGYTGKWKVKSFFSRWRGRPIDTKETVAFNGSTFLIVGVDGKRVSGLQMGVLSVRLVGGYKESRKIFNEIVNGSIDNHGKLKIDIEVRHRDSMKPPEGTPPKDLGEDFLKDLKEAPFFKIELSPVQGKPKYLRGSHCYNPGHEPHQQAIEDWDYLGF